MVRRPAAKREKTLLHSAPVKKKTNQVAHREFANIFAEEIKSSLISN